MYNTSSFEIPIFMAMKKYIYVPAYLLLLTIAFSSCNSTTQKMKENTEITVEDSTSNETQTVPADSTVITDTSAAPEKATNVPLRVIIDNLSTNDGEIEISVYTPKNKFPEENGQLKKYRFKPENLKLDVQLKDLPYGELAIALFHDENNNGKIDKNMIGIPTEPYGFSNNYKPTIKAPNFDNCKFAYNKDTDVIRISLLNKKKK